MKSKLAIEFEPRKDFLHAVETEFEIFGEEELPQTDHPNIKRGYHFSWNRLRNGIPLPKKGKWLKHKGRIIPCEKGLHMSEHPFDAVKFAPGPYLHKVELRGSLKQDGSPSDWGYKWVGRKRRILASINAVSLLEEASRFWALQVADLWNAPDKVKEYLQTGDENLEEEARRLVQEGLHYAPPSLIRNNAWQATAHVLLRPSYGDFGRVRPNVWDYIYYVIKYAASAISWALVEPNDIDAANLMFEKLLA